MVTPASAHSLIEEDFAAGLVNCLRELKVGLLGEMRLARVRAPQKAAHRHTFSSEVREYDTYFGARTTQPLVGITLPIGELDRVAVAEGAKRRVQRLVILGAIDQYVDAVSGGPRRTITSPAVEQRAPVAALLCCQEPIL
jgi:hypothetical protein